jgi:threonine dehydrogenase-like Zn-dependent dehydrogenase
MGTGSTVNIAGGGPVGMAAATSALLLGASVVIVGDPNKDRREHAHSVGFKIVDLLAVPQPEQVEQILGVPEVDPSVGCGKLVSALDLLLLLLAWTLLEVAGEGTDHALLTQTDDRGVRAPRARSREVGSGAAHPTEYRWLGRPFSVRPTIAGTRRAAA